MTAEVDALPPRGAKPSSSTKTSARLGYHSDGANSAKVLARMMAAGRADLRITDRTDEPDNQGITVKRFYYDSHDELRTHLADFLNITNLSAALNHSAVSRPMLTPPRSGRQNQNA